MVQTSRLGQFVLSKDNMDINVISLDAHQVIQQKENTSQKSHNFDPLCECVMCPIRQKKGGRVSRSILERGLWYSY